MAEPGDGTDTITIGVDLACQVASFMNVEGNGLHNVCVAFGPNGAAEIRRDYLLDNDVYIQYNLEIVSRSVLASSTRMPYEDFRDGLAVVDKCKRNIMTWMEVNDDWRERVTVKKMDWHQGYVYSRGLLDPRKNDVNFLLNNIAIAIEIGLLDVVRHLVEEMNVPIDSTNHIGFYGKVSGLHQLVVMALVRGNVTMIQYLMSRDPSTSNAQALPVQVATTAMGSDYAGPECFKLFLELTNVDVNRAYEQMYNYPLLSYCLRLLGSFAFEARIRSIASGEARGLALHAEKIGVLLEFGADPFREYYDVAFDRQHYTAFRYAQEKLTELKEDKAYQQIWPMWEMLIEKMEAMRISE